MQHINILHLTQKDLDLSRNNSKLIYFHIVISLLQLGEFRFASLQSTIGKSLLLRSGKRSDDISSIGKEEEWLDYNTSFIIHCFIFSTLVSHWISSLTVLVTEKEAFFKSNAVLRIAQKLDGNRALPILGNVGPFVPGFVRNTIYDFVAANRYKFGEAEQCRLDFGEFDDRFFKDS